MGDYTLSQDLIKKLYIEPTSNCNFNCTMCPRNSWFDEAFSEMDFEMYKRLIAQASEINSLDTIFFGGVAEPMSHKDIYRMIELAKSLGVRVELITNGSFLDKEAIRNLLQSGLDMLWFSLDSAHTDSFEANTKGNANSKAHSNMLTFNYIRRELKLKAEFGIAFVAMKSNIDQLPDVIRLGGIMGCKEIKVSNVIPYNKEMQSEMLYQKALSTTGYQEEFKRTRQMVISIPVMDFDRIDSGVLSRLLHSNHTVKLGENSIIRKPSHCKFINDGSLFVKWNGDVSPCIALLHNSKAYLNDSERELRYCSFGNVNYEHINNIWDHSEYKKFRERVTKFDFSPCTICGGCSYVESNKEDCFGNEFPTCGGCLWAEGFAQCP